MLACALLLFGVRELLDPVRLRALACCDIAFGLRVVELGLRGRSDGLLGRSPRSLQDLGRDERPSLLSYS